jgi:hypothetical protein
VAAVEFDFLHSFTKSLKFFLKQPGGVPLSGVTGRRYQTEEWAPDLFHEMTTFVEGEAPWLSESTPT